MEPFGRLWIPKDHHKSSKIYKKLIIFRPHNVYGPNMGFDHVIPELMMKSLKAKNKNRAPSPIAAAKK